VPTAVEFSNLLVGSGIDINTPNTITFSEAGFYRMEIAAITQFTDNSTVSHDSIRIWPLLNGVPLPINTTRTHTFIDSPSLLSRDYIIEIESGDQITFQMSAETGGTGIGIYTFQAIEPTDATIPSIKISINKISN
jgi:hypothetical protein